MTGKIIRFIFCLWLISGMTDLVHPESNLKSIVNRVSPAVVSVVAYDAQNRLIGHGTGFNISPNGIIVSNFRVIEDAFMVMVMNLILSRRAGDAIMVIPGDMRLSIIMSMNTIILKRPGFMPDLAPPGLFMSGRSSMLRLQQKKSIEKIVLINMDIFWNLIDPGLRLV